MKVVHCTIQSAEAVIYSLGGALVADICTDIPSPAIEEAERQEQDSDMRKVGRSYMAQKLLLTSPKDTRLVVSCNIP